MRQNAATKADPDPPCPVRPGSFCALCVPGAAGPENCGLVYLVMSDAELREQLESARPDAPRCQGQAD